MAVRRSTSSVVMVLSTLLLVLGLALTTSRASAMIKVPENTPGLLSIYTDSYPLHYSDMAPGEEAFVRLDVLLSDAEAGELSLKVRKSGDLATVNGGLEMEVQHCEDDWTNVPLSVTDGITPECDTGATILLQIDESEDYRIDSPVFDVDDLERNHVEHLLVTLAIPATTDLAAVEGLSADFGFGLFASGLDDPRIITPGSVTPSVLAFTGFDALYLALIAVGAIGIGVAVRVRRGTQPEPVEVNE